MKCCRPVRLPAAELYDPPRPKRPATTQPAEPPPTKINSCDSREVDWNIWLSRPVMIPFTFRAWLFSSYDHHAVMDNSSRADIRPLRPPSHSEIQHGCAQKWHCNRDSPAIDRSCFAAFDAITKSCLFSPPATSSGNQRPKVRVVAPPRR